MFIKYKIETVDLGVFYQGLSNSQILIHVPYKKEMLENIICS